ncbi:MAG: TIGR03016 family PEP-CTERM system-associated outer membrane protein [Alphaproteobacteria bacterium]|nr:MAG: TIGR03016 family PEP-CTERM system-associated outer membrane protein [Alphaproteobacteria bacterium]
MANGAKNRSNSSLLRGTSLTTLSLGSLVLASGLTLLAATTGARAVEVEVTPTADLKVTQTDNVYLTDGGEEDDTILSIDLGLQLRATSPRLQSALYYQFSYDKYDTADEYDGTRHDLRATNTFEVSPEFFYIDLNGSVLERARNRNAVRAATDRTYGGEQVRVTTVSLRPYIETIVGGSMELLAGVELSNVSYSDTDVGAATVLPNDIDRVTEQFRIGTENSQDPFTWSLNVRARQLDDDREDLDVLASAFFGISGTTRLIGRVGYDQADTNGDGTNEIEETLWRVGFDMRPSARTTFRAEAGQRYNRTTYDMAASHTFRESFALTASYNHTLVTDAGQFVELSGTPIFDDTGALIGLDDIVADIVNDSYIQRRARVQASGNMDAFSYQLGFAYLDREFEFALNDNTITQVQGRMEYLFSDRLKAFASVGLSDEDADVPAQETDIERYSIGAAMALTQNAYISLQGVNQSYEYGTGMEVTENAIVLSVTTSW